MSQTYRVPVTEADRIRAGLALHLIAACTGVSAEQMRGPDRLNPRACRARWLALYLAYVAYGWPLERVGHAFGVNRATVSSACRWAEDARDRPALDTLLDRLEAFAQGLLGDAPVALPR
ncbi:chromosomal replication initiator DnaA [Brevundimonas poindexterae]|uniref:chromosomal replication initiator DnaA n=1 Tax=Brevundimonas poindexterae TaxID=74325 RepID=UPI001CFE56A4|nr:chromosomal replication initiator DnaA [Brevundimonas poindexterae]